MMYVVPGSSKWWPCEHPAPDDFGPEQITAHACECPAFGAAHPEYVASMTPSPDPRPAEVTVEDRQEGWRLVEEFSHRDVGTIDEHAEWLVNHIALALARQREALGNFDRQCGLHNRWESELLVCHECVRANHDDTELLIAEHNTALGAVAAEGAKWGEEVSRLLAERRAFAERAEPLLVRARNAVDRLGWRRDDLDALLAEVREWRK